MALMSKRSEVVKLYTARLGLGKRLLEPIVCLLSTLTRWPLWAVTVQYKLIASNSGLSKVSAMDRCLLRQVLLYMC